MFRYNRPSKTLTDHARYTIRRGSPTLLSVGSLCDPSIRTNTRFVGLVLLAQTQGSIRNVGSRKHSQQVRWCSSFLVISNPSSDDLEDFVPYAIELANTLKNTIFVDQVPYQYQKREELMQLLEEHITENIVKVWGCGSKGDLFSSLPYYCTR